MTLVPEQRPDKNGKVVTRHVRSLTNQQAARVPLPAPSVQAGNAAKQRAKDAAGSIYTIAYESSEQALKNLEYLAAEQPHFLDRILKQSGSSPVLQKLWQRGVKNGDMEKWFQTDFGSTVLERDLAIYPLCVDLIPATGDNGNNPGLTIEYTHKVESSVRRFSDDAGPLTQSMCKALTIIGITRGVYAEYGAKWEANKGYSFSQSMVEAEYIARNIDRVEPIAAELVRRGNYDVDFVESLLSVQKPLMEGAL